MREIFCTPNSRHVDLVVAIAVLAIAALFAIPSGALQGVSVISSNEPTNVFTKAATGVPAPFHPTVTLSSADDWPELHQIPSLKGYAFNSPISSGNASSLGVAWDTYLYGSALDSPVVAYDSLLGETLAYVGTETGNVVGVNVANGQIVWGTWVGSPIRSTPLVYNASVYIGTFINPTVFKLNASTGAIEASVVSPRPFEATPTIATPPGGVTTLYFGTVDTGPGPGPFLAINAKNLSIEWEFTGYNQTAGSWDSASYAVSASGVPMVLFGTDNPDSSVYALNAVTGRLIWWFQCDEPNDGDWDVAAGVTISPPGANGFAQGVAYATNKIAKMYALDLNNGTLIWETDFNTLAGVKSGVSRSTPALDGTNLIFGFANGLVDLNAKNGSKVWIYTDPTSTESIASPAIAGGHGTGIVITGDVGGELDVVSVVGGTQLYNYETGDYITASPAVSGGNILIVSANGYLYDFAVGGGDKASLPTTSMSSPAQGSMLTNPVSGSLTLHGNATDSVSVSAVQVAVQENGVGGPWWDAANGTWSPGPVDNPATLGSPGGRTTSWNLVFPVAAQGATFQVFAYATSSSGQSDLVGSDVDFSVVYKTTGPHLEVTPSFAAPGSIITLNGGGFGGSKTVLVTLLGSPLATIFSRANGSLPPTRVTIPLGAAFGFTSITAAGKTTTLTSTTPITIANSWDQLGYDFGRTGYEPNDPTLNYLIFPGANNWVQLAWHFDPGTAINASPAVVDGVAYVADTAGQLFAVDNHNGGLLWTFTLTTGAAMDGSPAVDVSAGLVFVGANDGTLDAVYISNGTLAWSQDLGGHVTAPVFDLGELYVSTSSGKVDALAESTGTISWTVTLASKSESSVSLNLTAALLVVGEANGDVVGLNSSTGALIWTFVTGGAVTAPALISGGTVYVGSNDHSVYALHQATGVKIWSFKTQGEVQDTGSLSDNYTNGGYSFFIGSNDGYLYALKATTGKQLYNVSMGSAIVGVSTVKGVAVFETAGGTISASRTYVAEDGWRYYTGGHLASTPVIVDATIYVCAEDGNLYAFTPTGSAPD
ncbi:MAG: PQQ-binding-like beta-propeller repeat protein [Thermoplasmata archaeon]|nr:PQQ-binding-like beta-propeller repeat protein [Thermoplasmata archaeon]